MPRDMHKYASKTTIQLIIGGGLLLFVVGVGLIALIYGPSAGLMGLLCLLGALLPIGLIALLMFGLDAIVNKNKRN